MDSGDVIPGLNEDWTLLGAKLNEWIAGFLVFLLCGDIVFGWGRSMPLLIGIWVTTTLSLASFRRLMPDEERGMMNKGLTFFGFPPPNIPAPADIQPRWSGAPISGFKSGNYFDYLGLGEIFPKQDEWISGKNNE